MDKDTQIIEHIFRYCIQIENTINRFGEDFEKFEYDWDYKSSIAFNIQQIGELAKKLSDTFKAGNKLIPWKDIAGMRDLFAHQYASMNVKEIWQTATEDIPELKKYCEMLIKK